MLQINQKDRISWDKLVCHPLFKSEELSDKYRLKTDLKDLEHIDSSMEQSE